MAASKHICLLLKAYLYADQTSKLLVIFLCPLVCICDCRKTLRQLFGSHFAVPFSTFCFLTMYVFRNVFVFGDHEWGYR